jgi:SagB-type dehydrogenase family enzyme
MEKMKKDARLLILLVFALLFSAALSCGQPAVEGSTAAPVEIALPAPDTIGKVPVEQALAKRRSVRQFAPEDLTLSQIGQLCWAAQGITEPTHGLRTAPSAMAAYPLDLYVVKSDGVFRYLPQGHKLIKLSGEDKRAAISTQASVGAAPVVFVMVGVMSRTARFGPRAERFVAIEAGHVGQNLHLQAVALGLGSVSVGGFQDADVVKALDLPEGQTPFYVIPVGKPAT